jgi:hypothetical protein
MYNMLCNGTSLALGLWKRQEEKEEGFDFPIKRKEVDNPFEQILEGNYQAEHSPVLHLRQSD